MSAPVPTRREVPRLAEELSALADCSPPPKPNWQGGRPSRYPNEPMTCYTIRVTKKQRDKLDKLGGGEWVRTKINAASV